MTGSVRNSNHGNHEAQPRGRPCNNNNRKQIACRLCNRVFQNTQALITHIESHIVEEEMMALRRQNQQLQTNQPNSLINPSQRNLFLPIPFRPASSLLSREIGPPQILPAVQRPSVIQVSQRNTPPVPTSGSPSIVNAYYHIIHNNSNKNFYQPPNTPAQVCSSAKNAGKQPRTEEEELDPNDFTRPFLRQLDRPIPIPITRLEDIEKEKGVDLTLRLWPKTP